MTRDERAAIERAAAMNCQTVQAFIRDSVNDAAADCGLPSVFSVTGNSSARTH